MGAAKKTTDHDEIKRWVTEHGGCPATVKRTRGKTDVGLIRIDFPGYSGVQSLEKITWRDWFRKFDDQQLAFLYQTGKNTRFNKLVRREPQDARPSDRKRGPSRTTRGGRAAAYAMASERKRSDSARGGARKPVNGRSKGGGSALEQRTRAELYQRARSKGIANSSRMSKAELVAALSR